MINYVCDICGKVIGNNRAYCHETPKYEIHIRKQSNSFRPGGEPHIYSEYVDICPECQEKVNEALDPIFKGIVDEVVEGSKPFCAIVADDCEGGDLNEEE